MRSIIIILVAIFAFQQNSVTQELYNFELSSFRKEKIFKQTIEIKDFKPEILNAAIFYCTNEIRKDNKLTILTYAPTLETSATMQSQDMADNNFFSHTNPKNKKHREPEDRAMLAGITNPHIAENIIEGFILQYTSGQQVEAGGVGEFKNPKTNKPLPVQTYLSLADELLKLWMHSPGHKANILSDKAYQLGCGTALYFMHDFNEMPCVKATQNFQWFEPVLTNNPQ